MYVCSPILLHYSSVNKRTPSKKKKKKSKNSLLVLQPPGLTIVEQQNYKRAE